MATAPDGDDMFDQFLSERGHETGPAGWNTDYNKKQCPECGGLHAQSAAICTVCGWEPR